MDDFWEQKVYWHEVGDITPYGSKCARIDGCHYIIEPDNQGCNHISCFCGFGGHRFIIQFIDGAHKGEIVETTNLWHQGKIPEDYKDRLPNNAVWIKGLKWEKYTAIDRMRILNEYNVDVFPMLYRGPDGKQPTMQTFSVPDIFWHGSRGNINKLVSFCFGW